MPARRVSVACLLACCSVAAHGAFDPTDVIQPSVSFSLSRDDNLYRLPSDLDPRLFGVAPDRVSDTTRVLGVGLKVDKRIARQRLLADVNVNESTFDNNPDLDHVGGDARLSWFWQVGNLWSGELAYRKRRSLAGFADFRFTDKDLIDAESLILTGGYQFHPS